ncbi:Glyoxalase-like domain protein [compost metagenome]
MVVDDLDAALVQAVAAGARQEGAIREADWGRIVTIADPFGHGWCLLQFRGRGYDEIST